MAPCLHTEKTCVSKVPLLNHLSPEDQLKIAQCLQHENYQKGDLLFQPDEAPKLFIVNTGKVKIYQLSPAGKEQLLRVLEPGDYEGESQLFGAENTGTYAEALQETAVCQITHETFQALLRQYPEIALKLLELNAIKLQDIERNHQLLIIEKIEERLAIYLLNLAQAHPDGPLTLPMPMKELASFLGTTPETLSRKFRWLQDQGYIQRDRRQLTLLKPDDLKTLVADHWPL